MAATPTLTSPLRAFSRRLGRIREVALIAVTGTNRQWQAQLADEVVFWDEYLASGGLEWKDEFRQRLDPELPLQQEFTAIIDARPGSTVRVLDVGAGPLTVVGKKWAGRKIEIVAVDPLAADYDRLLSKHGIRPVCRTTYARAEGLTDIFPAAGFDFVHARNSIDHSSDPIRAISEMLRVVKPGCWVYLEHKINEGRAENYHGLHQWNFFPRAGEFFIAGRGRFAINVSARFRNVAETQAERKDDSWFVVCMKKRSASEAVVRL
jgi:ubiquinone/menaquinone biosynthesis C-methylase UbiE